MNSNRGVNTNTGYGYGVPATMGSNNNGFNTFIAGKDNLGNNTNDIANRKIINFGIGRPHSRTKSMASRLNKTE